MLLRIRKDTRVRFLIPQTYSRQLSFVQPSFIAVKIILSGGPVAGHRVGLISLALGDVGAIDGSVTIVSACECECTGRRRRPYFGVRFFFHRARSRSGA